MDLKNQLKQVLRMCGHAIVITIHERLNVVDQALRDILEQNTHIAGTQTALLQSNVYLVENLKRVQADIRDVELRIAAQVRDHCAARSDVQALTIAIGDVATKSELQTLAEELALIRQTVADKSELQALAEQLALIHQTVADKSELQAFATQLARMRESVADKSELQALAKQLTLIHQTVADKSELQAFATQLARMHESVADKSELQALAKQLTLIHQTVANKSELQALAKQLTLLHEIVANKSKLQSLAEQLALVHESVAPKSELQALANQLTQMRETIVAKPDLQLLKEEIANVDQRFRELFRQNVELLQSGNDRIEKAQEVGASAVQSGVDRMLSLSETIGRAATASLAVLEPVAHETKQFLTTQSVRQVCIETSDYLATNPELGLLSFLYSYLPCRTAFDIGAHVGDFSDYLLKEGYEVYAFEPYPPSYTLLTERLGAKPKFHAFNLALGSASGEFPLHLVVDQSPDNRFEDPTVFNSLSLHGMPSDLKFTGSVSVPTRTLSDLHNENVIPADAGVVKIDTEGYDLEVIRGMHDPLYAVVMVEFWDTHIPFGTQGLLYTLDSMVDEMRQRGYFWYIVIYRVWGENQTAFFCNHNQSVPGAWGNILFFRHHRIFTEAQKWCSAVLPRTYFKHVPSDANGG